VNDIVTLLLASQPGRGFASSRWLEPWGASCLLQHSVDVAHSWPLPLGLVVLGAAADEIVNAVDFGDAAVLVDPEWEEGEAASLRAGLDYLQRLPDVAAVLLADAAAPAIPLEVVPGLLAAHRNTRRPVTVPKYRYSQGRPFLLDREIWPRLLGLEGAALPEAVLATHNRWVEEVWFDHLAPAVIATPSDLSDAAPRR
jgi:molybdenum cofactor cytidylyltransferase